MISVAPVGNANEEEPNLGSVLKEMKRWKSVFAVVLVANVLLIVVCLILCIVLATGGSSDGTRIAGMEPPLPAMTYGTEKPRIIFAQDITYPPYAYL